MKPLLSPKLLAVAALALAAAGTASAAHARSDIVFSVGVQPGYYSEPAPVYVQPRPVYAAPRPVYVQPQPVYEQYGYEDGRDWRDADRWEHRRWYGEHHRRRFGPYGDRDGDGVANRYDRFPDNPYRH